MTNLNRDRWIKNFTEDERRMLLGAIQDGMRPWQNYPITLGKLEHITRELKATFSPDTSEFGQRFAEKFAGMIASRPATRRRRHCGIWTPPRPAKPILLAVCDVSNPYRMQFYRCLWYRIGRGDQTVFGVAPQGVFEKRGAYMETIHIFHTTADGKNGCKVVDAQTDMMVLKPGVVLPGMFGYPDLICTHIQLEVDGKWLFIVATSNQKIDDDERAQIIETAIAAAREAGAL